MKQYSLTIFTYLLLFTFQGCITEYEAKGLESTDDLLVIDGTISSGESIIKLRNSVILSEELTGGEGITDASIYIECSDGTISPYAQHTGDGTYKITTGDLDTQLQYKLRISAKGEDYESTFLAPLITPNVEIEPIKEREKVFITVSTKGSENQPKYYRWMFKENWEFKSDLFGQAWYDPYDGMIYDSSLTTSNNFYYCWETDTSRVLYLGSSNNLSENIIFQNKIIEIPSSHRKLSILYHVAVEQIMIRKEAYDYFSNLQKNIEQTGDLFSPIPSEMRGNISCITNPHLPVIGYIEVSNIARQERFIWENEGFYEAPVNACETMIHTSGVDVKTHGIYEYSNGKIYSYAPKVCVDCTRIGFGTKNKPSFWPTEHL